MTKIYDCFMIYNELDMAELRFNILRDVVDYHVVVEAGMTHSGLPKPAYFKDAWDAGRFTEFDDRIIHYWMPELPGANSWERERNNRTGISTALATWARPEDWVIVGDADEIADPRIVTILAADELRAKHHAPGFDAAKLELGFYYYDFNHRVHQGWAIGACRYSVCHDANKIRTCNFEVDPAVFLEAGWHFSYFGDAAAIMDKARAFMHYDWIDTYALTPDKVQTALDAGTDLWGRDLTIERVPLADTLPRYVLEHRETYAALGWCERETEHAT